jgi:hypothetical protein
MRLDFGSICCSGSPKIVLKQVPGMCVNQGPFHHTAVVRGVNKL